MDRPLRRPGHPCPRRAHGRRGPAAFQLGAKFLAVCPRPLLARDRRRSAPWLLGDQRHDRSVVRAQTRPSHGNRQPGHRRRQTRHTLVAASLFVLIGWRNTWAVFGIIAPLLVVAPALIFVRRRPEDIGLHPDGEPPRQAIPWGRATDQAARLPAETPPQKAHGPGRKFCGCPPSGFWLLPSASPASALPASISTFSPYVTDVGYSPLIAASFMSTIALTQLGSTLPWGILADRYDVRKVSCVQFLIQCVGLVVITTSADIRLVYAGFFLYGTGLAGSFVLREVIWANFFGGCLSAPYAACRYSFLICSPPAARPSSAFSMIEREVTTCRLRSFPAPFHVGFFDLVGETTEKAVNDGKRHRIRVTKSLTQFILSTVKGLKLTESVHFVFILYGPKRNHCACSSRALCYYRIAKPHWRFHRPVHYFAYSSNMNWRECSAVVKSSQFVCVGRLAGYQFSTWKARLAPARLRHSQRVPRSRRGSLGHRLRNNRGGSFNSRQLRGGLSPRDSLRVSI